eukprot:Hpha_TRINITY_DN16859_c1_g11::TRINITY_DN16859_c1_g11_i1::g.152555::m.152555
MMTVTGAKACWLRCSEWFVRKEDSVEDRYIKRAVTPLILCIAPLNTFFLWITLAEGSIRLAVVQCMWLAGYATFLAGGMLRRDMRVVLDVLLLVMTVANILGDATNIADMRPRQWSFIVIFLDAALVFERRRTIPLMIGLTLAWLLVATTEFAFRFGLVEAARSVSSGVCSCPSPPCEISMEDAYGGWLVSSIVVLIDFYLTSRFATERSLQLKRIGSSVEVAAEVAAALARYDVDGASDAITEAGGDLPEELADSYRLLLGNLLLYRPYLPAALFARAEIEQVSTDSEFSFDDSVLTELKEASRDRGMDCIHLDSMRDLQLRQRRCTVLQAVASVDDDEAVTPFVTAFASVMVHAAQAHKGVLLVLGGEHVMVGWNTHVPLQTHSYNAVVCALSVQHRVPPSKQSGIGVCRGLAFTGNTGSVQSQMAPVVVGPLCLLSAQLVRLTPLLKAGCLCNEGAYEQTRGDIVARIVDVVRATGGGDHFVYQLIAQRNQTDLHSDFRAVVDFEAVSRHTRAFSAMRELNWAKAKGLLFNQLRLYPTDYQALRLLRLCHLFEERGLKDPMGTVIDSYVRYDSGWTDYEEMASHVDVSAEVKAWSVLSDPSLASSDVGSSTHTPHTIRSGERCHTGFGSETEDDAVKHAIAEYQRRRSTTTDLREFVDLQGRAYVRGNKALGKGAFGEVFLGMATSGGLVALKFIFLPEKRKSPIETTDGGLFPFMRLPSSSTDGGLGGSTLGNASELIKEVSTMCNLRHENIVSYLGSAVAAQHLVLILEYVPGGSLFSLMVQFNSRIPISSIQRYIRDTINGLSYLHGQGVVHLDLKPHNVLVAADGTVKLADFGASEDIQKMCDEAGAPSGTPWYMAPEQCLGKAVPASDIWSLGIMVAELITGERPWPSQAGGLRFIGKMSDDDVGLLPELSKVEEVGGVLAMRFCRDCCRREARRRPQLKALLSHAFMIS